jgi:hypothetical protein
MLRSRFAGVGKLKSAIFRLEAMMLESVNFEVNNLGEKELQGSQVNNPESRKGGKG